MQKPEFDKGKSKDYDADLAGKKAMVREIDRVTRLTANDLFQTFDDYEQYFFKFMIGYSYTMINKLMQEGKPVVGFVVYRRMSNNEIADSEHGWDWPLRYGAHLKFAALFGGSGEQATVVSDRRLRPRIPGTTIQWDSMRSYSCRCFVLSGSTTISYGNTLALSH